MSSIKDDVKALLGTMADGELAKIAKLPTADIKAAREAAGIKRYRAAGAEAAPAAPAPAVKAEVPEDRPRARPRPARRAERVIRVEEALDVVVVNQQGRRSTITFPRQVYKGAMAERVLELTDGYEHAKITDLTEGSD